ncbi:MAG: restriction endonuclease subunit S, partial [Clostridia bacterium]|nr:restriction endonuclease subunit S [Clostridia bacterium]
KIEALKIYKIGLIQESYNNNCGNKIKMKDLIIQKSIRNAKNEVANVYSVSNKEGFILQSEQFKDRTVASEDTQNYKIVEKNDFAYNPARINVGSIARMKQDVKGIISPMYICFRGNEKIIPEYLEYFFKSYKFTYEMNKRLEGSVRMCLSYESMINIPIALPCIEEQRKVSDLFNSVGHKINQEERKLKKLNEIKKGLLQKMFI